MAEQLIEAGTAAFGVARSFTGRRWLLKPVDAAVERDLLREISPVLARLLAIRGVTVTEAADYLAPRLKNLLPDPNILKDMPAAVARVSAALAAGERIAVFGDYDVDGSTSAALLGDFLSALGTPPRIYIPDRMTEGYGPSPAAMKVLQAEGASLVITVDCGAAAIAALEEAKALGMDVVVLDHHRVETAPPALAHVNPNQPDDTFGPGAFVRGWRHLPVPGGAEPALCAKPISTKNARSPNPICGCFSIWWVWRPSAMWCR